MSRASQQWYFLTEEVLGQLSARRAYSDAAPALERVRSIKALGHTPLIFRVLDDDDQEQGKISQGIADRAKHFPDLVQAGDTDGGTNGDNGRFPSVCVSPSRHHNKRAGHAAEGA